MKQIQLALQFTLLEILCLTVLGVDNFTVQFMGSCTSSIDLKVAYSGTGTVDIISWKFSKMADPAKTLNMIAALCQAGAGADPAFPVSRMNFTCDDTENIYTATISNFNESTDAGDWEAALSIGGSYTNFKSVSIECESTTTPTTSSSNITTTNTNMTHAATSTQPPTTTTKSPDNHTIISVSVAGGVVVIIIAIICLCIFCIRKKREKVKKMKRDNNKKEHETVHNAAMQQAADARL